MMHGAEEEESVARLVARATGHAVVAVIIGIVVEMSLAVVFTFILPPNLGISPDFATACAAAMLLAGVLCAVGRDIDTLAAVPDRSRAPLVYPLIDEEVKKVSRLMATSRIFHQWRMAVRANHRQRMRSRWERADAEAAVAEANYMPAWSWCWSRDDSQLAGLDSWISTAAAGFHDTEDSDLYACSDETMLSESLSDPSLPPRERMSAGLIWQAAAPASDSELSQRSLSLWTRSTYRSPLSSEEEEAGAATGSHPPLAHQPSLTPPGVSAITRGGGWRGRHLTPSRARRLRQIRRRWSVVHSAFRVWAARENPPPHI